MISPSNEDLDVLSKRIVFRSKTFDPATRLPLVVMNSTAFPKSPDDYTPELMSKLIKLLPDDSYALVFFACGAPNKPSWSWISKIYNMLDRQVKKRVGKVYIVHESWWVRAVTEMFRGVVSHKFKKKIIHVSSLSQLAQHIDITLINILPEIYIHNLKIEPTITVPRHHFPIFGVPLRKEGQRVVYPAMWKECINYLQVTAQTTKNIFQSQENRELLYILRDCYDRGQLLDLDDYGPNVTASLIKLYLQELPNPLIPIKYIPLPIKDTADYNSQVFLSLPETSQKLFKDLIPVAISVIKNTTRTNQTLKSLSSDLPSCFIGRYASNKESLAIAVRFTKNLIEYWAEISSNSSDISSSESESEKEQESVTSRKSSYDKYPKVSSTSSSKRSSYETLYTGLPKHLPTSFASRNSSTTSISSSQSLNTSSLGHSKVSDSTGRLKSQSDDFLPSSTTKTRNSSSSSTSTSPSPPPLPPPLRKSASTAFRSESIHHNVKLNGRKSMSNLDEQPAALKSMNVSTKRGKMVAELAKLYEV